MIGQPISFSPFTNRCVGEYREAGASVEFPFGPTRVVGTNSDSGFLSKKRTGNRSALAAHASTGCAGLFALGLPTDARQVLAGFECRVGALEPQATRSIGGLLAYSK